MYLKKGLTILTATIVAFSASACSSASTKPAAGGESGGAAQVAANVGNADLQPEPGAKLVIWEGKDEKPFIEAMAKEFQAKYNISVELQDVPTSDQKKKIKTDGPAGLGADIIVMPHSSVGDVVTSGVVLPNDFYAEETKKNNPKEVVDAVSFNGMIYGYPRNVETYLLYYNKSLVKKEDLASWDSIIKFAKGFNDVEKNKFGMMWEVNNYYYSYAFIAGSGGYVFGKNNTDPKDIGINNDGAVEGMKFYKSLRDALPIKAADATLDVKTNLFQTGKLAINLDGVAQMGNFTKEKLGFEVGAIPFPAMPNGKNPVSFSGVKAYYVSSFSKFPNAAKLFIHYVTSKESMMKDFKLNGTIPARTDVENEAGIKDNEIVKAYIEQVKHSQPMPNILETNAFWAPATATLEPIWNGGDIKKILDKAADDIKLGIAQQSKK